MLGRTWVNGLPPHQQPFYQSVIDFTYWPLIGSFTNWNILKSSQKATTSATFEEIHHIEYIQSSKNIVADALSIFPINVNQETTHDYTYKK